MKVAGEFTDEGLVGLCICGVWHLRRFERRGVWRFGELVLGGLGVVGPFRCGFWHFQKFLTEDFWVWSFGRGRFWVLWEFCGSGGGGS